VARRRRSLKPRVLSAIEAAEEVRHYENWLVQRVIEPVYTPAITKRWKRIRDAGASAEASDLQTYFNDLCRTLGRAIAVDLFEHVLDIDRTKYWIPKQQGRPAEAVDDDRDKRLLATFDGSNPESLFSQARDGELVIGQEGLRLIRKGEKPRRITQDQLAQCVYKGFGLSSATALLRRLKSLRSK
jgi:hypothetical protein